MCAWDNSPSNNDQTVAEARESLQAMLQSPFPDTSLVAKTVEALEALRSRLATVHQRRFAVAEASQRAAASAAAREAQTQRLDTEIIQAKLQAGELLTERDSVARDLSRARRALTMQDGMDDGLGVVGDGSCAAEEEDLQALVMRVAEEMEKMRVAEKGLVDVVNEINVVRKQKADLEEKMKAAQEEW